MPRLVVRWTVGDVSSRGFEALTLSIAGVTRIFGDDARYVVCVNTIRAETAAERVGDLASAVEWMQVDDAIPGWLRPYIDSRMAQGVAWKFAPVHIDADLPTIALDNDVVLWRMPKAVSAWLADSDSLLILEDVQACYGCFRDDCPGEPRNSGIRGIPARFPLEHKAVELLGHRGRLLRSEADEQGLQVAIVSREKHHVISRDEVSICGYFRPHQLEPGSCGAHFVGVNLKKFPYHWNGHPGETWVHGFWDSVKPEILGRLGPMNAA